MREVGDEVEDVLARGGDEGVEGDRDHGGADSTARAGCRRLRSGRAAADDRQAARAARARARSQRARAATPARVFRHSGHRCRPSSRSCISSPDSGMRSQPPQPSRSARTRGHAVAKECLVQVALHARADSPPASRHPFGPAICERSPSSRRVGALYRLVIIRTIDGGGCDAELHQGHARGRRLLPLRGVRVRRGAARDGRGAGVPPLRQHVVQARVDLRRPRARRADRDADRATPDWLAEARDALVEPGHYLAYERRRASASSRCRRAGRGSGGRCRRTSASTTRPSRAATR